MQPRSIDPEWRWTLLLEMVKKGHRPDNEYVAQVYDVALGNEENEEIEYALELVRVREYKETLQAFFYCRAKLSLISDVLEIDIPVLQHVEKLVMDETQFRNRLERFRYVRKLVEDENILTERGREYTQTGMVHGPEVLAHHFRLGDDSIKLDPKKLIEHFIQTAYYLSANARGNSITAETTKQARMWMLDSIKYMEAHKDASSAMDSEDEALLAIEERKATVTVEELGVPPDEIYH